MISNAMPKHKGKSDTEHDQLQRSLNEGTVYYNQVPIKIRLQNISHIEDELITLNNKIMISNAMRNTMTGLEKPQIHRFCSIKKQLWVTATLLQEGAVVVVVVW
jgi:capsule polysaccharide export protein KpsE/RkpR